jgi:ubiquitin-like protein Pup
MSTQGRRLVAEQTRKRKPAQAKKAEKVDETVQVPEAAQTEREKRLADIDEILDGIDEILEEEAEEFVKNFLQKGGQ